MPLKFKSDVKYDEAINNDFLNPFNKLFLENLFKSFL
jgi:hypothetical protein